MLLQPVNLGSQNATSAVNGATTEPRIRINRPDDENARCRVSRVRVQPKNFSQPTQPLTTLSTSNAISPPQKRTEPSGPRRCRRGATSSLRREPNMPADLLRALFGNVTVPIEGHHRPIVGDTWQHDPYHRRGVAYRDPGTAIQLGRSVSAPPDARRAYRGYESGSASAPLNELRRPSTTGGVGILGTLPNRLPRIQRPQGTVFHGYGHDPISAPSRCVVMRTSR